MPLPSELRESAVAPGVSVSTSSPKPSGSAALVACAPAMWVAPSTTVARGTCGAGRLWEGGGCAEGARSVPAPSRSLACSSWSPSSSESCSSSSPSLSVRWVLTAGGCSRGLESTPSSFLRLLGGGGREGMSGNLCRAVHLIHVSCTFTSRAHKTFGNRLAHPSTAHGCEREHLRLKRETACSWTHGAPCTRARAANGARAMRLCGPRGARCFGGTRGWAQALGRHGDNKTVLATWGSARAPGSASVRRRVPRARRAQL